MNLRIENQSLRFRISKNELEVLCSGGGRLTQNTVMPALDPLVVTIIVAEQEAELSLTTSATAGSITLQVAKAAVEKLYQSLPAKEGIKVRQSVDDENMLELALEVDIRTQKRSHGNRNK